MSDNPKSKSGPHGKNALEWVVFAISGLLVLIVVGFLVHNAIAGGGEGSRLECSIVSTEARGDSTEVIVAVRNKGLKTAAEVNIAVKAGDSEGTFTVDFIPRGGRREGVAVLEGKHDAAGITARVSGYMEP